MRQHLTTKQSRQRRLRDQRSALASARRRVPDLPEKFGKRHIAKTMRATYFAA